MAGSFILTQKSLSEAPHRYAGVLKEALNKLANDKDLSYTKADFGFHVPKICNVTVQRTGKFDGYVECQKYFLWPCGALSFYQGNFV